MPARVNENPGSVPCRRDHGIAGSLCIARVRGAAGVLVVACTLAATPASASLLEVEQDTNRS